jgi:hypothetical protein
MQNRSVQGRRRALGLRDRRVVVRFSGYRTIIAGIVRPL